MGIALALVVSAPLARAVADVRQTLAPGARSTWASPWLSSLVVVVAASLYPAAKAAGMSPAVAMRRL